MTIDPQQISSLCDRRKRSAATGVGRRRAETEGHQEVDREFGPGRGGRCGIQRVMFTVSETATNSHAQNQIHWHKYPKGASDERLT